MWAMTVENSHNAIILLRVTSSEQPVQGRLFKHEVSQQFLPHRNDGFLVDALDGAAKIESVDWTILDDGRLMPLVKASVYVLKLDKFKVKSLLEAGWIEHKSARGGR